MTADGQQKSNSHLSVVLATNLLLKYYCRADERRKSMLDVLMFFALQLLVLAVSCLVMLV